MSDRDGIVRSFAFTSEQYRDAWRPFTKHILACTICTVSTPDWSKGKRCSEGRALEQTAMETLRSHG